MEIKPIKNEQDYDIALERIYALMDAKKGTKEGDQLEVLSILVEDYESVHHPIGLPDPVEAIKFKMEQLELNQKDLVGILGFPSRVSEILNKKRKLTLDMIRKLNKHLSIPTEVLIQEY